MPESSSNQRPTQVTSRRVDTPRGALAKQIPRRAGVSWWLGILLAVGFAAAVTPAITAEHWLLGFAPGAIAERHAAPFTVRAPMSGNGALRVGGGLVVARGELATRDEAAIADAIAATMPRGPVLYLAFFALTFVLGALFTHHVCRSTKGRLVRVQVVSLAVIVVLAAAVKLVLLSTAVSALVVPIALLAMVPTMVLDRIVGLASGVLAALVVSLLAPFDIGLALLLLVQTAAAGLVVAERPRRRWLAALTAGVVTTLCTAATYLLLTYLTSGHAPDLRDPLHSPWLAAAIGPAVAAMLAVPLIPIYQLLVGEITQSKLIALEDLGQPLLRRIAGKAPGSWQHSLMMANMAEIAANAIGANGRLVRVGAYYHDLGKSLQPKYFIENLEPGETSPHDLLPPEVSCDAIFAHVTEGIVAARKAGLHERIVDFMHMHHGNGVLEYFWAKCREQGNPRGLTVEDFRYPGHPPQSRETALLAICDAVEAASRTLKQPDAAAIDSLVQRIVYGKLHLGQLDESGLSMADLRRISDSLRETIRHANHGRIEYPWQKAGQDASAGVMAYTTTAPRLDSLDRKPGRDSTRRPLVAEPGAKPASSSDAALAVTADVTHSAPQPGETSDAARIRAGTARNAHPASDAPPADRSGGTHRAASQADDRAATHRAASQADDRAATHRAASQADDRATHESAIADRWWTGSAEPNAARAGDRAASQRESPTTLTGRAPGPSSTAGDPSLPRTVEPNASIAREAAPREPAARETATTLPGRAPGPSGAAEATEATGRGGAVAASGRTDPRPAERRHPRPATAPPHDYEAAGTLSEAASTLTGRLTESRAAGAPAPSEPPGPPGPPEPVDLDNATTNPPGLRRAATAHPAAPTDPAEIAAALASLVSRVAAAPFGSATGDAAANVPPAGARIPLGSDAAATQPVLPLAGARIPLGSDAAVTQPVLPLAGARIPLGSDAAVTRAVPPLAGARVAIGSDAVVTQPVLPLAGARVPIGSDAMVTQPVLPLAGARVPIGSDAVVTQPVLPLAGARVPLGSDAVATRPVLPLTGAPRSPRGTDTEAIMMRPLAPPGANAGERGSDAAITHPVLPSAAPRTAHDLPGGPAQALAAAAPTGVSPRVAHEGPGAAAPTGAPPRVAHEGPGHPPPSAREGKTKPGTMPARASALADRNTRPGQFQTLRGHTDEASTLLRRQPTDPPLRGAPDDASAAQRRQPTDPLLRGSTDENSAPVRRPPADPVAAAALGTLNEDARVTTPRAVAALAAENAPAAGDFEGGETEPSIPVLAVGDQLRVDVPLRPSAEPLPPPPPGPDTPEAPVVWTEGLAARIDAALDGDEWGKETPIAAPTKGELRALLGRPDPTRQQPIAEVERLQRRAAQLADPPRRSPHPTTEVDPDDIEAAIEVAPPARRPHPNAIAAAKPRKPE